MPTPGESVPNEHIDAMRTAISDCLMPEGSMYEGSVVVLSYVDDEGHSRFSVWWDVNHQPLHLSFGLIKMAEAQLMQQYAESDD